MDGIRQIWEDWVLEEPLGEGAFGLVYRACHVSDPGLTAAVKMIEIPAQEEETDRLRSEGKTETEIQSLYDEQVERTLKEIRWLIRFKGTPHIVSIEDFRVLPHEAGPGATICLRMELLRSLREYVSDKALDEDEVLQVGIQICQALETCHAAGILHQDIKPDNIFVQAGNSAGVVYKLGDFGSAILQQEEEDQQFLAGAKAYFAPEMIQGEQPNERFDLYSLGMTLYRFMNGNRLPFLPQKQIVNQDDQITALNMRLNGMPLPPPENASAEFTEILLKACAYEPGQRYGSATEMRKALESLEDHRRRRKARENRKRRWQARWANPAAKWIILGAALALLGVCGLMSWKLVIIHWRPVAVENRPMLKVEEDAEKPELSDEISEQMSEQWALWNGEGKKTRYPIPRSLDALGRVRDLVWYFPKPVWTEKGKQFILKERPGEWEALLVDKDGRAESLVEEKNIWQRNGMQIPEDAMLLIVKKKNGVHAATVEYEFDALTLDMKSCRLHLADVGQGLSVNLEMWEDPPGGAICVLQPAGKPRLEIWYDEEGRFSRAEYAGQKDMTMNELLELEGMEFFP